MALRNYLYAKHVHDEFAVSLLRKTDKDAAQPKQLLSDHSATPDMHIASQPRTVADSSADKAETASGDCHNDVCNNCADCKSDKTKPKIPVEIGDGISKLSLREIDFTF